MTEQTVLEVITDFLNRLQISDKKIMRLDVSVNRTSGIDKASLDIDLCEHTISPKISISIDNLDYINKCPFCRKESNE